jgi:hypothetical protein
MFKQTVLLSLFIISLASQCFANAEDGIVEILDGSCRVLAKQTILKGSICGFGLQTSSVHSGKFFFWLEYKRFSKNRWQRISKISSAVGKSDGSILSVKKLVQIEHTGFYRLVVTLGVDRKKTQIFAPYVISYNNYASDTGQFDPIYSSCAQTSDRKFINGVNLSSRCRPMFIKVTVNKTN